MLFSPNRLLTSKEQWLLVLVAAALLLGTVSLFWYGRRAAGRALAETPAPAAVQAAETPPPPAPSPAPDPAPETPPTPAAAKETPPPPAPEPKPIAVAIRGGVRRGGLFRLPPGSRVADLIMEAGGAIGDADVSGLNLAAPLADGTTLTVPVAASRSVSGDRLTLRGAAFRLEENPAHYLTANAGVPMAGPAVSASAAAPAPAPVPAAPRPATAGGGLVNLNTAPQSEIETLPGIGPVLAGRIVAQRDARPFRSVEEVAEVPGIGPKRLEAMRPLVTVQ
ncbi:MAG: ComEA family DNA-binding protein [Candidatus Hydrogenedens sp.]|nr:ComEA family DNA-binding protein [Candidatus Hydrogenedentota bacterium]NLF56767.1 ComEA family DNA-binding protein [Candidatus Hydrogenedens sp.]